MRGIKQGDSISSQLYVMSLEPLLHRLRKHNRYTGLVLPTGGLLKLNAYADDVSFIVTDKIDVHVIFDSVKM